MDKDVLFMREALQEADKARKEGEVPVGAILVKEEKIIARGYNKPVSGNDPTAHAEIVAIRNAAKKNRNYRLIDCELYVTLEPCAMCLGAAVQSRIKRLVFGALDPKNGAVKSVMNFPFEKLNHRVEIRGGVLAEECGMILSAFFETRR